MQKKHQIFTVSDKIAGEKQYKNRFPDFPL